jgi:NADH:ubiquinone oxidoreductase subunit E
MDTKELSVENIQKTVRSACEAHGYEREAIIPVLLEVNRTLGYLPTPALVEVGRHLRTPVSQVFSVASFYYLLTVEPRGKHVIQMCESAPCHVMGGRQLYRAIIDTLGIEPGRTTPDGKWTFILTSCLGTCGVGPVVQIDDDLYGNLTPAKLKPLLARYTNGGE